MYSILIVDDEDIVRTSIVQRINWMSLGFNTPYQASNGKEAYELALRIKPDLVFADIKMPIMSGLELANKLKESLPDTHVVIFSGYDDFKYAQESIGIGVLDYILKPLGSKTLTKKLSEIVVTLDTLHARKDYLKKMESQLHLSLPLLKENFLNRLVCTPNNTLCSVSRMRSLGITLDQGPYIIALIEINLKESGSDDVDLYLFSSKNIIRETLGNNHLCFSDVSGQIVLVYDMCEFYTYDDPYDIIVTALKVVQEAILYNLNQKVTIGLGKKVHSPWELYDSYTTAAKARDCKYTMGTGEIYMYNDLRYMTEDFYYPSDQIEQIIIAVKSNNKAELRQYIQVLYTTLSHRPNITLSNLKFIFIELVTSITKILAESDETSTEIWTQNHELYTVIEKFDTLHHVAHHFETIALQVAENLSQLTLSSRKSIVLNSIEIIQATFSDPNTSLKTVASSVAVSPGYLSTIFKSENGLNFNAYLTQQRMEEAKKLLATTDMTVYDIAFATGHSSSHYFSIRFKKYSNFSPSHYRTFILDQRISND